MDSIYNLSERTVKKYTIYQAYESAKRRLNQTGYKGGICANAISGREDSDRITLKELNEISDKIVDDTLFHSGWWH